MGAYFNCCLDDLSPVQLTDYFSDLIGTHSWSAVKLDLYGFKFYSMCWARPGRERAKVGANRVKRLERQYRSIQEYRGP